MALAASSWSIVHAAPDLQLKVFFIFWKAGFLSHGVTGDPIPYPNHTHTHILQVLGLNTLSSESCLQELPFVRGGGGFSNHNRSICAKDECSFLRA